jgi:hypothetical protein
MTNIQRRQRTACPRTRKNLDISKDRHGWGRRETVRAQFVGTDTPWAEPPVPPCTSTHCCRILDRRHVGQGLGGQQIGPRDLAPRQENVSAGEVLLLSESSQGSSPVHEVHVPRARPRRRRQARSTSSVSPGRVLGAFHKASGMLIQISRFFPIQSTVFAHRKRRSTLPPYPVDWLPALIVFVQLRLIAHETNPTHPRSASGRIRRCAAPRYANDRSATRISVPPRSLKPPTNSTDSTGSAWINEPGLWQGPLALVSVMPAAAW